MSNRMPLPLKLLSFLALPAILVLVGCSKHTTRLDLYWPYDMWDGMNRRVFALEELGYEIYSVDTDNGTIMARRWPSEEDRSPESRFDSRRAIELYIQFPIDPDTPILIDDIPPAQGYWGISDKQLREMVEEIAEKFRRFGGFVEEVEVKE